MLRMDVGDNGNLGMWILGSMVLGRRREEKKKRKKGSTAVEEIKKYLSVAP